ncbi:MAG: LssY C-terminal domain-containing protein [Candidatus Moraniibacteriota bacterium]
MLKKVKSVTKSVVKSAARGVRNDPEVRKIVDKYPRTFDFIKKRLTPDEQFGLYLTIGIIIAAVFGYLFMKILFGFFTQDLLVLSDLRVLNIISAFRTPRTSEAMLFITYLCDKSVAYLGVFLAVTFFIMVKKWRYSLALLLSVFSGEAFLKVIKILVERKRPPLSVALIREDNLNQSFPSGHAFLAVTFYGLLGYFLYRKVKNRKARIGITALFILFILLIGASRIYLGVHWPTDVLASLTAGSAWLAMTITVLEIRRKFNNAKAGNTVMGGAVSVKFIGVCLLLVWLGFIGYHYSQNPLSAGRINQKFHPTEKIIINQSDIPDKLFVDLPRVSETISGKPQEPINVVVVGSREELEKVLNEAGWLVCDRINMKNIIRLVSAAISNKPYPQAPGVPSLWDSLPNDLAFEKPTESNTVGERNHLHLWDTPFVYEGKEDIWFGTAHFDQAIKKKFSVVLPTHTINPAIDEEREKIKSDFMATGEIKSVQEFQVVPPTLGKNQSGDIFFTDGKGYVFYLKD